MAKSKRGRYETNVEAVKTDDGISPTEREHILEFLYANEADRHTYEMPDGKSKAPSTLAMYARNLGRVAKDLEPDLTEATTLDINELMDRYLNGEVESTKDEGITNNTVRNRQTPLRRFYYYFDDLGIDREDIYLAEQEDTKVDERDMFTKEEVQRLRDEAKSRGTRDACLVDLLLYTGQRISAILGLRLKDMRPDEGIFHLNEDSGDLKGASGKRPLLGAQKSVRDWKRQHPTGEPEDFLITATQRRSYQDNVTLGDKLAYPTAYNLLQNIGRNANVDKNCRPHNFRHVFVTYSIREYGMKPETVKHLIGHSPGSAVLEEVYSHLTDEDYIEKAEESAGIREPENESPLTPPICQRCNEPLDNNMKVCPYCGYTYAPDVFETKEGLEDDMWERKSEVEPGSEEDQALNALKNYLKNNPEAVEELID